MSHCDTESGGIDFCVRIGKLRNSLFVNSLTIIGSRWHDSRNNIARWTEYILRPKNPPKPNQPIEPMNTSVCNPALSANFHPNRLFRLAESLFNDARPAAQNWTPLAEVSETENSYAVKLDLPEVNPADVKVTVKENVLRISGERKAAPVSTETDTPGAKIHLQERVYGSFARSFSLPKNADPDAVSADYKQGVLTVSIPKRAEAQPKEIEVRIN